MENRNGNDSLGESYEAVKARRGKVSTQVFDEDVAAALYKDAYGTIRRKTVMLAVFLTGMLAACVLMGAVFMGEEHNLGGLLAIVFFGVLATVSMYQADACYRTLARTAALIKAVDGMKELK